MYSYYQNQQPTAKIHLGDVNKITDLNTFPPLRVLEHLTNITKYEIVRR